jgi:hypothetical protein
MQDGASAAFLGTLAVLAQAQQSMEVPQVHKPFV